MLHGFYFWKLVLFSTLTFYVFKCQ